MNDLPYKAEGAHKIDGSYTLNIPKRSKWKCELMGSSLTLHPVEGDEPCWFHRKMQGLILGHKWINTEKEK